MRGSVNAQTHTGQMLPLAPNLTPSRSVPVSHPQLRRSPDVDQTSAIQLTKLGFLPESYDFGEAAGLAFSFFVPFSALAPFTSTSFAVIV